MQAINQTHLYSVAILTLKHMPRLIHCRLSVPTNSRGNGNFRMASLSPQPSSSGLLHPHSDGDVSAQYPASCPSSPFSFASYPPSSVRERPVAVTGPVFGSPRHTAGGRGGVLGFDPGGSTSAVGEGGRHYDDNGGYGVNIPAESPDMENHGNTMGSGLISPAGDNMGSCDREARNTSSLKPWHVSVTSENAYNDRGSGNGNGISKQMLGSAGCANVDVTSSGVSPDFAAEQARILQSLINSASSMNLDNSASFREGLVLDPQIAELLEAQNSMVSEDFLQKCIQEMQQQQQQQQQSENFAEDFSLNDPIEALLSVDDGDVTLTDDSLHSTLFRADESDVLNAKAKIAQNTFVRSGEYSTGYAAPVPDLDVCLPGTSKPGHLSGPVTGSFDLLPQKQQQQQMQSRDEQWHQQTKMGDAYKPSSQTYNQRQQHHRGRDYTGASPNVFSDDSMKLIGSIDHLQTPQSIYQSTPSAIFSPTTSPGNTIYTCKTAPVVDGNGNSYSMNDASVLAAASMSQSSPSEAAQNVYLPVPFSSGSTSLDQKSGWQNNQALTEVQLQLPPYPHDGTSSTVAGGRPDGKSDGGAPRAGTNSNTVMVPGSSEPCITGLSHLVAPTSQKSLSPSRSVSGQGQDWSQQMTSPIPPRIPMPNEVGYVFVPLIIL